MKTNARKYISLLLALCMVMSLLPAAALAAGADDDHGEHSDWTALSGTINSSKFYQHGEYYLANSATANSDITISYNVTLCLNGNTLNMGANTLTVSSDATLTICDCGSGGTITGTESYSNLNVISVEGGTLNLESGTISGTAAHSGSLISVTGGTLNVTGGTISLNHTGSVATNGVQAVKLSNSTGSFTGGKVSLATTINNARATTVYQESGIVTMGGSAEIVFEWTIQAANPNATSGSGALCVTNSGQATINTGCTITASRTDGEMAGAVSIGKMISYNNYEVGTATITGGGINGALVVYGTAEISDGSFDYIQNWGTLTMTGGTVKNDIDYGILTNVQTGKTDLSNVTINAKTGVYVNTGLGPTIRDGVTINATQYGVDGSATLVGDPVIEGGTADLYIHSMRATTDHPSVDATAYTGGALTVQERKFPDAHQGGYIGCAIEVSQEKQSLFSLTNSNGNFVYQYDEASGALRLYNRNAHPICGASCDHGGASHSNPAWQQWTTPSNYTLTGGSYYLTGPVTLSQPITVTGDVNLCLNGNTIECSDGSSPFQVTGGSLTICDCQTGGQLTGGITATGGQIGIYGGTISGGAYAVDLGGDATLTLAGSPALSGTSAALKLYTKSGTTLDNAAVDATDYTGGSLEVEEKDVPGGANGFAIKGVDGKFSLKNDSDGYHYAYEGGYVIRPDHTHSYTYNGNGSSITETCDCGHSATATISIRAGADLTYTGSALTPAEVTYSGGWQGGDLTINYFNNTDAGTATATITKDNATASVTFIIEKASQTAPEPGTGYSINYTAETITVNDGYEVYTAQDGGTQVTSGSTVTPGTTYYIRREGDTNHNPSGFTSFTVAVRPDAPSVTAVAESIKDKHDGKVTGVNTTMEYKIGDGEWQGCPGTEITDLAAGTAVLVRVKATSSAPHGEAASCTIGASENTLTVTFEENGGSAVTEITGLSYNATITAPAAPTKTGYAFAGWYKEAACTNPWNFGSDKVTASITLYAKWTPVEYDITYNLNGGTVSGNPETYTVESEGITLNIPTRTGYTFAGWTGTDLSAASISVTIAQGSTGDRAYTATWTANTYAITYAGMDGAQHGENHPDSHTYATDTLVPNPTKDGYTFAGWLVNGTGDADKNLTLSGTGYTADITLTAQWTLDAPTVTITGAPGEPVTYGEKITLTATASHAASGLTYTYQWYKGDSTTPIPGANQSTLTLKTVADSGSYTVKVTASDTDGLTAEETSGAVIVSIGKANPVTTWPTASSITYGQSLSESDLTGGVAVPGTFAWENVSINPTSGSHSYTVTFTPTDAANYNSAEAQVTVSVAKKTLTPSVASVQDKVYDGDEDTTGIITLTGAVLGDQPTASGVFTFVGADADTDKTVKVAVKLDDDWDENYVLSTETLTDTANITPKTVGLTWSGYENLVYDGEPVGVTAAATGLVSGDRCTVTVENGAWTDAGTYTAKATGLSNDNYLLPADVEQSYTIAPRPVQLSWSESSFTYDGSEKTFTATIENLVPDDVCALTYRDNEKTEHGSYTAEVTALGNDNYTLTNGTDLTHSWSIGKAVVSFTVSGNSHTYDGEPKAAEVTQDAGQTQIPAGGYEVKYGGAENQTEAGTYDITVTITNGNFCFEDGKDSMVVGQLSIGEQAVEIPTADDTAFTYNGAEQTYAIAASDLYTISGNVQKDAGTYTVTVALKDKANYTWPDGTTDDKTYTFIISPKTVTATWVGLEQVYGSVEPVYVILSGLAEGDEGLEAVISGVSTEAGEHPLSASLKNYDIINSTATLRIQQKPVTITVTDNAVTVGGEPAISAPGLAESDYEVVYKDKNGNEVTPSEPGTYEVWVEITNPNYRHPDGSSEKQVGSVVVSSGTPRTYEVSFAGSGAGGSTAGMKAAGGSAVILPECGFTKPGSVFTGWKYGGVVYKPGDSFTMPYADITITAQWTQARNVSGTVKDEYGVPVPGAAVSIWQGSDKLGETTTGPDGSYSFTGLAPGSYNVSASVGEKTVTSVVTVDEGGAVTGGNIILPEGNTSTRVEITPGSPDLVVGELDRVFDNTDGEDYTAADAETVKNGGMVEITFTADEKKLAEVRDELQQLQSAGGVNLSLFLDCTLEKEVYDSNGTKDESASGFISRSSVLLEVRLPLPTEMQGKYGYSVSRIHEGEAQALSTSANSLGEYFEVSADKSALILHVCCFSIYAVGYENSPVLPPLPTENAPNVSESEHGSVTVFPNLPTTGTVVTITPKPDEGYTLDKLTVTDASGKPVELRPNGDGSYSFTQPSGAVTITVTFKVLTDISECPRDASCPMSGYTDLNMGEWYHDGIHYCLDEGLMDGVDAGMFAPNATTSRAMIVTILWRLQGSPEVEAEETFTDVAPGDWYADAIAWAAAEGVAEGYEDGSFRPNDAITREQLAAMLWRYAGSPEADGDLSVFADGADTSSWAEQAMSWAVAQGLITGVDSDRLDPKGQATRAQTATILMRFAQSMTR